MNSNNGIKSLVQLLIDYNLSEAQEPLTHFMNVIRCSYDIFILTDGNENIYMCYVKLECEWSINLLLHSLYIRGTLP